MKQNYSPLKIFKIYKTHWIKTYSNYVLNIKKLFVVTSASSGYYEKLRYFKCINWICFYSVGFIYFK